MRVDKFDDRYNYYFCGINGIMDINYIFDIGLSFDGDKLLENDMTEWVLSYGLEKSLIDYAEKYNYNRVYVVKIPSYYLGWMHRNGKVEPFVPVLISEKNKTSRIVPELIYGVYDNNNSTYIDNANYNPLYEFNGLSFANVQLRKMYKYGCFRLYMDAMHRNNFSYEVLKVSDEEIDKWDRVKKHYSVSKISKVLKKIFK